MIVTEGFYQKHKQIIPAIGLLCYYLILVLTWMTGIVEIEGQKYHFEMNMAQYAMIVAVPVVFTSYFFLRSYYKYILLTILLLGLVNVIQFTASHVVRTINFIPIPHQPAAFNILILVYIVNFKRATKIILDFIKPSAEAARKKNLEYESEKVEQFKNHFKNKSAEELNYIISENKYTAEAKEAARQLLNHNQ